MIKAPYPPNSQLSIPMSERKSHYLVVQSLVHPSFHSCLTLYQP